MIRSRNEQWTAGIGVHQQPLYVGVGRIQKITRPVIPLLRGGPVHLKIDPRVTGAPLVNKLKGDQRQTGYALKVGVGDQWNGKPG